MLTPGHVHQLIPCFLQQRDLLFKSACVSLRRCRYQVVVVTGSFSFKVVHAVFLHTVHFIQKNTSCVISVLAQLLIPDHFPQNLLYDSPQVPQKSAPFCWISLTNLTKDPLESSRERVVPQHLISGPLDRPWYWTVTIFTQEDSGLGPFAFIGLPKPPLWAPRLCAVSKCRYKDEPPDESTRLHNISWRVSCCSFE